ncbi:MAG: M13 family metallopeptidase [Bacteroidetes bacterium]|nr:M13 family metallopeptidase [Bacteroidota bacterium]MBK9799739.1 M13 family metallopeptidase [Bacteroidota bacterium]
MNKFKDFSVLLISSALLLTACAENSNQSKQTTESFSDPLTEHIDSTVSPAEDFFSFANGRWFKENPIPASESYNGIFLIIQDSVNAAIRDICEKSAKLSDVKTGTNQQKIGDLFYSGMDTLSIEKAGITPLKSRLDAIAKISSADDLTLEIAELHKLGVDVFFNFDVRQDEKISSQMIVALMQGGLGLPERDYYSNTDTRTLEIRSAYQQHIQNMLVLAGEKSEVAKLKSQNIIALETSIAKACRKMEALRDPFKNYNKLTLAQVEKLVPAVKWTKLFTGFGLQQVDTINMGQPEFFKNLNTVLNQTSMEDVKAYLSWNLISNYASYLSKDFEYEDFLFYTQKLSGNKEQKPRWQKVVETTDKALGELIGQEYVAHYLPANSKEKLIEIGNNIQEVYRARIKQCDWMSELTKEKALKKLNAVSMKIGYPDKWRDHSALSIDKSSFAANMMNVMRWNFNHMIEKYGKPVDRTEWHMTPQTYNAYYNPSNNEIVIPACNILVPGYTKTQMPEDAILYGIIGGSTFGHEITHGFDDEGSLYDENGNLNDWWSKEDRENFKARTALMVKQYDNYVMLDTLHLRGLNTLGENLADLGGVLMGYEAFKKTKDGQANTVKNGYTAEQRYFLSYAFAWLIQRRNEEIAKRIMTDVHAPSKYRVNGPLSVMEQFYSAFNVKPGNEMYREKNERVKIW